MLISCSRSRALHVSLLVVLASGPLLAEVHFSRGTGSLEACRLAVTHHITERSRDVRQAWIAKPLSIEAILKKAGIPVEHLRTFRHLWRRSLTLGEHYEEYQVALEELESAGEAGRLALCVLDGPCPLRHEPGERWFLGMPWNVDFLSMSLPRLTPVDSMAWITRFWQLAFEDALEMLLHRWKQNVQEGEPFWELHRDNKVATLASMLIVVGKHDMAEAAFQLFDPDFSFIGRNSTHVRLARQELRQNWSSEETDPIFPPGRHPFDRVGVILRALRAVANRH